MLVQIVRALEETTKVVTRLNPRDDIQMMAQAIVLSRISEALRRQSIFIREENSVRMEQSLKQHTLGRLKAGIGIPVSTKLSA